MKNAKEIKLSKGKVALVNKEDLLEVSQYNWCVSGDERYAVSRTKGKYVLLHRLILKPNKNQTVDHINGNGLDCRRENLRLCTQQENTRNQRLSAANTSGYKGVSFHKSRGKWRAYVKINGVQKHLGLYSSPREAAKAYNKAALELFKQFAKLNKI